VVASEPNLVTCATVWGCVVKQVFVKGVHDGMAMATAVPMSAEELDRTMIVCEVLAVAVEPPSRRQSRIAATADLVCQLNMVTVALLVAVDNPPPHKNPPSDRTPRMSA